MKRITCIWITAVAFFLSMGCGPNMNGAITARVPELKQLDMGTYDLGEFKNGQSTPFRMTTSSTDRRLTVGFKPEPENRHFNIVVDDGRVLKVDDDNDLKRIAGVEFHRQSFYLEFKQDMRMIVIVFEPDK